MPPGTPLRNIRVDNKLWAAAQAKAAAEGRDVSDAIREFLTNWTKEETP